MEARTGMVHGGGIDALGSLGWLGRTSGGAGVADGRDFDFKMGLNFALPFSAGESKQKYEKADRLTHRLW